MSQPSRSPAPAVLAAIAVGALLLGLLVFWSRGAPSDLKEWTPADHDQPAQQPGPAQPGRPGQQVPARPKAQPEQDAANLVELAWGRSCATCHGGQGRGDGPQGPMVRAPDLTRAEWQGRVTDEDIKHTISTGRNSMPKFDLPPAVLDGLVKRIRAHRGN
jgi:mono/diheme cytochrome c family protein